jgi:5-methylcytosine-specific restriction endonuclease McrA
MNNKDRQILFDKFGGKCAYCGCKLKKGWHADHANTVHRFNNRYDENIKGFVEEKGMFYPENDCMENMMPSCPSCNLYKGGCDIETFRWKLGNSIPALNKRDAQYKFAKRFGLLIETGISVEFYFETFK